MSLVNNGAEIVISTPLRTAIGTFGGTLKEVPAAELGAIVAKEVISRCAPALLSYAIQAQQYLLSSRHC